MIIGTAGHIDHGKTTLVRALTGVDTDRLPEEKARGISIALGYAYLDAPGGAGDDQRIGFIDVPGHERLVHTMLSGATGIDHALLLVAADDGVMPQTREHLAVLSLLGITQGTVVITKTDRASAEQQAAVRAQVAELLAGTPLQTAPVLAVAATTGDGVPALRERLLALARTNPPRANQHSAFRLAIDRVFTLGGVGTVATGTIHSGTVQVGDELALSPGPADLRVRVRSLHAQDRAVTRASAGQRCALALAGVAKDQVPRGHWLTAPAVALRADRLDTTLTLWPAEPKPLRSGATVHVHLGAAQVLASVAVLAHQGQPAAALMPGEAGTVQLLLHQPLGAWAGDRVVLRDASASRTLAGGTVLDPFGPVRYRRTPARLAELAALAEPTLPQRIQALLAAAPQGIDLRRLAAAQGWPDAPATLPLPPGVLQQHDAQDDSALGTDQAHQARAAVLQRLADFHHRQPDELGPDSARLRRLAQPRLPEPLWRALLAHLQQQGLVARRGAFVHLPAHGVQLGAIDQRIAQKVGPALAAAGAEGAWARDLARDHAEPEPLMRTTLARLAQGGELHQVVRDLYYPQATIQALAGTVRQLAANAQNEVTAAAFRDATGLGRKRAIQLLEYFDRIGLLRRVGDVHRLRSDSGLFKDGAP